MKTMNDNTVPIEEQHATVVEVAPKKGDDDNDSLSLHFSESQHTEPLDSKAIRKAQQLADEQKAKIIAPDSEDDDDNRDEFGDKLSKSQIEENEAEAAMLVATVAEMQTPPELAATQVLDDAMHETQQQATLIPANQQALPAPTQPPISSTLATPSQFDIDYGIKKMSMVPPSSAVRVPASLPLAIKSASPSSPNGNSDNAAERERRSHHAKWAATEKAAADTAAALAFAKARWPAITDEESLWRLYRHFKADEQATIDLRRAIASNTTWPVSAAAATAATVPPILPDSPVLVKQSKKVDLTNTTMDTKHTPPASDPPSSPQYCEDVEFVVPVPDPKLKEKKKCTDVPVVVPAVPTVPPTAPQPSSSVVDNEAEKTAWKTRPNHKRKIIEIRDDTDSELESEPEPQPVTAPVTPAPQPEKAAKPKAKRVKKAKKARTPEEQREYEKTLTESQKEAILNWEIKSVDLKLKEAARKKKAAADQKAAEAAEAKYVDAAMAAAKGDKNDPVATPIVAPPQKSSPKDEKKVASSPAAVPAAATAPAPSASTKARPPAPTPPASSSSSSSKEKKTRCLRDKFQQPETPETKHTQENKRAKKRKVAEKKSVAAPAPPPPQPAPTRVYIPLPLPLVRAVEAEIVDEKDLKGHEFPTTTGDEKKLDALGIKVTPALSTMWRDVHKFGIDHNTTPNIVITEIGRIDREERGQTMKKYTIPLTHLRAFDFMVIYNMSGVRDDGDESIPAWKTYNEIIERAVKYHPECELDPLRSFVTQASVNLIMMHTPTTTTPPVVNPVASSSSSSASSSSSSAIASSNRPP